MKKITVPVLNVLLAFGVICIIAGLFLLLRVASNYRLEISFFSFAVIFTGAVLLYLSIVVTHRALFFFLGLYLTTATFFTWLVSSGVIPPVMAGLWPLDVILSGICLIATGIFKKRRLHTRYLFPGLSLIVLGGIFLLFSLNIITMSLLAVFMRWWPVLLILLGFALVVLFAVQQRSDISFPYEAEESAEADSALLEEGEE